MPRQTLGAEAVKRALSDRRQHRRENRDVFFVSYDKARYERVGGDDFWSICDDDYYLQNEEVMKRAKNAHEEGTSAVATIMFKDSCLSGGETRRNLAEIMEKSPREIRIAFRSRKSPEPGVTGVFLPAT